MKEITIKLNGKDEKLPEGSTLADLYAKYKAVNRIVGEVNGEIVYEPSKHVLEDGDVVEIVSFVGGG